MTIFTSKDFTNEAQWDMFKKLVRMTFVNALNPKFKAAVAEFADDHITFNEINDYVIEKHLEDCKDAAKEEA